MNHFSCTTRDPEWSLPSANHSSTPPLRVLTPQRIPDAIGRMTANWMNFNIAEDSSAASAPW